MSFYESADYIGREIARKEKELEDLRNRQHEAKIREFFWHIKNQLDTEKSEFLEATWKISFMGQEVELNNYSDVYTSIYQTLIDYMDEYGIPYETKED